MIHCHILKHEDQGMMAIEYIHDPNNDRYENNSTCICGEFDENGDGWPVWAIASIVVVTILVIAIVSTGIWWFLRRRRRLNNPAALTTATE